MIFQRAGATALATTAALAAVCQAAIAAPRPELTIRGLSVAGPELAGDAVLWGQRVAGGATVLRRRDAGGSTRTVFRTPPPPAPLGPEERTSTWIGPVVASRSRLAFKYGAMGVARFGLRARAASPTTSIRVSSALVAGPPDGPFAHVAGDLPPGEPCRDERTSSGDFALDGSVLAYGEVSDSCADPRIGDIRVVVAAPHTRWTVGHLESGPASHVAVAGRYVAWIEPISQRPAVSVYDWAVGRLAYWIPHPHGRPYLREVELARDGTVAFVAARGHWRANDLYTASPDSPHPRRVLTAQRIEALRLAGRRLLAVVATSKQPDDYVASHTRVVLADLRGRTRTLARYGPGVHVGSDPDFDGKRAAWSATRTSRNGRRVRPTGAIHVVRVAP